jgi:hypothetical protein
MSIRVPSVLGGSGWRNTTCSDQPTSQSPASHLSATHTRFMVFAIGVPVLLSVRSKDTKMYDEF